MKRKKRRREDELLERLQIMETSTSNNEAPQIVESLMLVMPPRIKILMMVEVPWGRVRSAWQAPLLQVGAEGVRKMPLRGIYQTRLVEMVKGMTI